MNLLLGQMQTATPTAIGEWIIVAVGLLGAGWLLRQIFLSFKPPPPNPGAEYITRAEFTLEIAKIEANLKVMLNEAKTGIENKLEKMDTYTHDCNHRLATSIQTLLLKMERVTLMQELAGKPIVPPKPADVIDPARS